MLGTTTKKHFSVDKLRKWSQRKKERIITWFSKLTCHLVNLTWLLWNLNPSENLHMLFTQWRTFCLQQWCWIHISNDVAIKSQGHSKIIIMETSSLSESSDNHQNYIYFRWIYMLKYKTGNQQPLVFCHFLDREASLTQGSLNHTTRNLTLKNINLNFTF